MEWVNTTFIDSNISGVVNTTFIDSDINGVGEYDLHRLIGGRRGRDRMVVGFLNLDQGKVYNIMW